MKEQITPVVEVVVKEKAKTFVLLDPAKTNVTWVAVTVPLEDERLLPIDTVTPELESEAVTAVVVKETDPATVTAVFVSETLTGFPTAFVIVDAVVDGVTVPATVTVLSTVTFVLVRATFTVLSTVTFVDERETATVPSTVTFVVVNVTLTGFPAAFVIVEAVEDRESVPTVMLIRR